MRLIRSLSHFAYARAPVNVSCVIMLQQFPKLYIRYTANM